MPCVWRRVTRDGRRRSAVCSACKQARGERGHSTFKKKKKKLGLVQFRTLTLTLSEVATSVSLKRKGHTNMATVEEGEASGPHTLPRMMRRECPLVLRKAATSWGSLSFLEVRGRRAACTKAPLRTTFPARVRVSAVPTASVTGPLYMHRGEQQAQSVQCFSAVTACVW